MPIPYASSSSRSEVRDFLKYIERVLLEHRTLDPLRKQTPELDFGTSAARTREIRKRYEEPFRLAFVGEFKAGKSALINALLGRRRLIPEGATPTTGAITEVWFATEERGEVLDHQGNVVFQGSLAEAARHADQRTPEGKQASGHGVRVLLYVNADLLRDLVIIDTPGLGANAEDDKATLRSLHLADAAILVLNGLQPGGEDSLILCEQLRRTKRKMVAAVTRVDLATLPEDSVRAAKEAFGDVLEGEPIGVSSPRILEALERLETAEAGEAAQARTDLEDSGYTLLQEAIQDALIGPGQGSTARQHRTVADLREVFRRLRAGADEEADLASGAAEKAKAEQSQALHTVNEILGPKVPWLDARIEDIVGKHVSEFINDLQEAIDVFIDDLFEHPLEFGFDSILARFSQDRRAELDRTLRDRFQGIFPDSRAEICAETIQRAVTRLLDMEWHEIGRQLPPLDDVGGFDPRGLATKVCQHLGEIAAVLIGELVGLVLLVFVPGGVIADLVWLLLNSSIGAHLLRRQVPRIGKAKREARVRVRNLDKEMTFRVCKTLWEVNRQTGDMARAPYLEAATSKDKERQDSVALAERWRDAAADLRRLDKRSAEFLETPA
jgi:hypothetical protein